MLFTPSPVTNCHTFSDPLPLERDVLYGRPHRRRLWGAARARAPQ